MLPGAPPGAGRRLPPSMVQRMSQLAGGPRTGWLARSAPAGMQEERSLGAQAEKPVFNFSGQGVALPRQRLPPESSARSCVATGSAWRASPTMPAAKWGRRGVPGSPPVSPPCCPSLPWSPLSPGTSSAVEDETAERSPAAGLFRSSSKSGSATRPSKSRGKLRDNLGKRVSFITGATPGGR